MAITLQEYFAEKADIFKVISMLLLHDLGEIGAGDTSAFDELGKTTSYNRELVSVKETLSHLPKEQFQDYLDLWNEFEKGATKEARYARCIDALVPLLNHSFTAERYANPDNLTVRQVLSKKAFIKEESLSLWNLTLSLIEESVARGLYHDDR